MFDSFDDEDMPRAPLVTHPAFPAVVAGWFATLLGLGSLILPAVLLDRLVDVTGLASLIPAAAPPLGTTARALVAVVAAVAGAGMGWAVARRVAASQEDDDEEPQRLRYPSGIRRPINVRDEIDDEGLFETFGLPVRGSDPVVNEEPGFADPYPVEPAGAADFEPMFAVEPEVPEEFVESPIAATPARDSAPAETREPVDFAAPSFPPAADEREWRDAPSAREHRAPEVLDELGLVDLAERLRASIERRREWAARKAEAAPVPADLEAAPAEEAAQAMAAYFGRPTAIGGAASSAPCDVPAAPADFAAPSAPAAASPEPDPARTDAALRAALAGLQRMSGSA